MNSRESCSHSCKLMLQLLQLVLLLLLAWTSSLAAAAMDAGTVSRGGQCAWRTCHTVTVDYLPARTGGGGDRSIALHRCRPSNNFPDKCHLSEFTSDRGGVLNFTMRGAQLVRAPLLDLCQFRRLSGLDLSENSIGDFVYPAGQPLGCLAQLRWLSLRSNALRQADLSQFLELPSLEVLDLSENSQLESLHLSRPPRLGGTGYALKAVLAAKCRIKQVDISLVRLPSLQDVDLSYNQVSRLTNRLDWRWTLTEARDIQAERSRRRARDPHYYARLSVQMVQNQIGSEAFDQFRLWGLPVPDLSVSAVSDAVVNQLKQYRDAFQSFLYIDNFGSTVACDCHLLHAWSYFRRVHADPGEFSKRNALSLAYWMHLPCEPQPTLMGNARRPPLTLASLTLADLTCGHATGCPPNCTCLERVSPSELVVDCRGAGLTAMPDRLPVSVHPVRYVLLLADNQIRALTVPPNASLVQALDLSGNRLTEAADFAPLTAFAHLHSLNLTGNPIRRIPPSLLALGRRGSPLRPSVRIGGAGFTCDCGLFEPEAWERLGRLLRDDLRHLRCVGPPSVAPMRLTDYRHVYCARQINTTSIVYRERRVFGQSALLWVGVGTVALFLLAMAAAVLTALRYRRRRMRPPAGGRAAVKGGPALPLPPTAGGGFVGGCVSPDYLPPGYSPGYETPRYAPPVGNPCGVVVGSRPATLVLLRGAGCAGGGGGAGGDVEFRGSLSSSGDSEDGDDIGGDCGGGGGGGGSDPTTTVHCTRHHGYCHGHGHGHSRRHARDRNGSRRHSWRSHLHQQQHAHQQQHQHLFQHQQQHQPTRLLLERELLLPPPLPPRPAPPGAGEAGRRRSDLMGGPAGLGAAASLVTDV